MLCRLFVYGTLMSSSTGRMGRAQRQRLARECRQRAAAVMAGRLYDLGRYPGLVDAVDGTDIVHGELVELIDPASSFTWLDRYEDIRTDARGEAEYRREQRTVRLAPSVAGDGSGLLAWVYVYARDPSQARRIASGRWPP